MLRLFSQALCLGCGLVQGRADVMDNLLVRIQQFNPPVNLQNILTQHFHLRGIPLGIGQILRSCHQHFRRGIAPVGTFGRVSNAKHSDDADHYDQQAIMDAQHFPYSCFFALCLHHFFSNR
ncbi:hypothetical protein D3C75_1074350 [compost metagenome]